MSELELDWLSVPEIVKLTGMKSSAAQKRELEFMGIPYRVRSDGKPIVHRRDMPLVRDMKQDQDVKLNLDVI